MSQPFIGEIRLFAGNFAPLGWAFCAGQVMAIAENDALFTLVGTTFGGDGVATFALPDLRGRVPIHVATSHPIGQADGSEGVTLSAPQLANHTHTLFASQALASSTAAAGTVLAASTGAALYSSAAPSSTVGVLATSAAGDAHDNVMPYLCVNYIISLFGIFPSRD